MQKYNTAGVRPGMSSKSVSSPIVVEEESKVTTPPKQQRILHNFAQSIFKQPARKSEQPRPPPTAYNQVSPAPGYNLIPGKEKWMSPFEKRALRDNAAKVYLSSNRA